MKVDDKRAGALAALDHDACVSTILREAVGAYLTPLRAPDGHIRWGLVEKRLCALVADIPDLLSDRAELLHELAVRDRALLLGGLDMVAATAGPPCVADEAEIRSWCAEMVNQARAELATKAEEPKEEGE